MKYGVRREGVLKKLLRDDREKTEKEQPQKLEKAKGKQYHETQGGKCVKRKGTVSVTNATNGSSKRKG